MAAADQIQTREGDLRPPTSDGAHRILADQHDVPHSGVDQRAAIAADSTGLVQSNTLPDLHIDGHDSHSAPKESGFMHFVHSAEAVVSDLAKGAVDEVVHHPGQVIGSALTGLAVGTIAVLAAPEIVVAAAAAGAVYGGYELYKHAGGWAHSADVVSNTQDHTAAEVAAAHQDLQGVGAGGVLIGAGAIGSLGAAPLAGAISEAAGFSAATSAEGATVSDILTNAVRSGRYEAVQLPNGMSYLRPVQSFAPMIERPAATAAVAGLGVIPFLELYDESRQPA